ncbi:MAG: fructose-6-phosphate aldolase [Deltaproteobacteria bacterium]|nr:fructose-6-phosphate aldolase [Deltaproteobacteria bacterium]
MKFFIDTANLEEIKKAADYGFLDGVTTNPTLMAKEGLSNQTERIQAICALTSGPVSAEVLAVEPQAMLKEARILASLAPNVAIKLPLTLEALKIAKILAEEGTSVNLTLVFSALQALLAAKVGAAFVSPFVGRLDDIGVDGLSVVEEIQTIYANYGYETEIIVASVRNSQHVLKAALIGADICTIPFAVISQLASHPLTQNGLSAFLADQAKLKKA